MPSQPHAVATSPGEIDYHAVFIGQERALAMIQTDAPREAIFAELVNTLELACDRAVVGSLMVLDAEGKHLRHGAAPSLPDIYNRIVDGIEIGNYGTCCAAAFRNEVIVTPDIGNDPGWTKLKEYPLTIRLLAAWSHPIRASDGRVLGTLGTYFRECRLPTEVERKIVAMLARTAALVIERRESRDTSARAPRSRSAVPA